MGKNNFFNILKKEGDSVVWKEVINHRKYIGASLKWCIGDGRKVCLWMVNWVFMTPIISFVDENNLHIINRDVKVHEFIDQETKEWNLRSIVSFSPFQCFSRHQCYSHSLLSHRG